MTTDETGFTTLAVRKNFYGKFPSAELVDLDSLLVKMRRKNRSLLKRKIIKTTEIRPLCDAEYVRLWGYIRHCCDMVTTWPNIRKAIGVISEKSGRALDDLKDECVDSMTVFVYTYVWRKYVHSDDCGLVFSTAVFGYKSWITSQNAYHSGIDLSIDVFNADNPSRGHKVAKKEQCSQFVRND